MFNFTTKFILAVSVLVLGGVSAANAQLVNGSAIKVNVPTAFVVSDATFEAGIYTIERTPSTIDSPSLLILRGDNGDTMIFDTMIARSNETANETELVFDTVDGTNFLSKIVVKGTTTVNELQKTKAQKKAIAEGVSSVHVITITNAGL